MGRAAIVGAMIACATVVAAHAAGSPAQARRETADRRPRRRHGQVADASRPAPVHVPPPRHRRRPADDPVATRPEPADLGGGRLPSSRGGDGRPRPARGARRVRPPRGRPPSTTSSAGTTRSSSITCSPGSRRSATSSSGTRSIPPTSGRLPVAPRAYEALLAECWDRLRGLRPYVNLISSTAARHDPAGFMRAVGAAYRESGRKRPIITTFGHNPYPLNAAEPPWVRHDDPGSISQADLPRFLEALREAFGGTGQRLPSAASTVRLVHGERIPDDRVSEQEPPLPRRGDRPLGRAAGRSGRRRSLVSRPGEPAARRTASRPLPARGRSVLQLRAHRRGPARRLAVGRHVARRHAQAFVRGVPEGRRARAVGRHRLLAGARRRRPDPGGAADTSTPAARDRALVQNALRGDELRARVRRAARRLRGVG